MCDNADSEILKSDVTIKYNNLVIKTTLGVARLRINSVYHPSTRHFSSGKTEKL